MAEAMTHKDYGDGLTSEEVSYMKGKKGEGGSRGGSYCLRYCWSSFWKRGSERRLAK
jgi:hypothetical protein